ncbi:related to FMP30 - mitochondrial inner membrane protein with a role in maintaining mitochondrial morphology [Ustilago trichophora]|uniref:Related to FMP30 - mitochondrial inner membrane protein with a role in maintaining mitochondrial morphology n=1 Tax=Ustilago trichophora TaxID=86804 RepID=A0A5C3E2A1_9BASI|nr:related to FMP30 - mitochondrial inner membrane protein with a role in maintaining mitochondrial morphology [Ustilago trichophora]
MTGAPQVAPLAADVKFHIPKDGLPPSHHVLAPAPGTTLSSYLPHWDPQPTSSLNQQNSSSESTTQDLEDGSDYSNSQNITCLPNSIALVDSNKVVRIGFRNPWPSWHKPTMAEVWQGLEWGEDNDPAIDYAMQDADVAKGVSASETGADVSVDPYLDSRPGTPDLDDTEQGAKRDLESRSISFAQRTIPAVPYTRPQKIKMASKQLLTIQEPDFTFNDSSKILKATWLGHAGVLVQLPPLSPNEQPIRVLFDPIFSQRCSPTQVAGPIRSYAAPCPISSLPPIDIVIISHNHYDHLDYDTIKELWTANKDRIRFVVPLGNKDWFVGANAASGDEASLQSTPTTASSSTWSLAPSVTNAATTSNLSIPSERVTELDWWDEIHLTQPGSEPNKILRVVCTPAQHGSGRYGVDANCALWSSWFLEHPGTGVDPTPRRIFFGGDTGCQFHGRSFPPAPPRPDENGSEDATPASEVSSLGDSANAPDLTHNPTYRGGMRLEQNVGEDYPACPAFEEIVARLGVPNFLMLPISVGATISFLRSYVPLPDSISPFPRISSGLTAANHMPPWDAVGVFDKMTSHKDASGNEDAVCMAIHWGTFISGPEEVLKTLGQLKWACEQHNIHFCRSIDALPANDKVTRGKGGSKTFIALNHGASLVL